MPASLVMGEPNMTQNFGGDSAALLGSPVSVSSDGTRVYVAD